MLAANLVVVIPTFLPPLPCIHARLYYDFDDNIIKFHKYIMYIVFEF